MRALAALREPPSVRPEAVESICLLLCPIADLAPLDPCPFLGCVGQEMVVRLVQHLESDADLRSKWHLGRDLHNDAGQQL
eukprot:11074217-Alexandrium_andersonii.AAC.1